MTAPALAPGRARWGDGACVRDAIGLPPFCQQTVDFSRLDVSSAGARTAGRRRCPGAGRPRRARGPRPRRALRDLRGALARRAGARAAHAGPRAREPSSLPSGRRAAPPRPAPRAPRPRSARRAAADLAATRIERLLGERDVESVI